MACLLMSSSSDEEVRRMGRMVGVRVGLRLRNGDTIDEGVQRIIQGIIPDIVIDALDRSLTGL